MRAQPGTMPLYFDRGVKKTGACGARYAQYSKATNLGEYMNLNPQDMWVPDFKWDFAKGHLRLLPSSALLSITPGERLSVQSLTSDPPDALLTINDCVHAWVDRVMTVATPTDSSLIPRPQMRCPMMACGRHA